MSLKTPNHQELDIDEIARLMQINPLYHSISLMRGLSTGIVGWQQIWDFAFLAGLFALCMWIAMRQMERKLIK